jgi:hypothetical protein
MRHLVGARLAATAAEIDFRTRGFGWPASRCRDFG